MVSHTVSVYHQHLEMMYERVCVYVFMYVCMYVCMYACVGLPTM